MSKWVCQKCTLENDVASLVCEVCNADKPRGSAAPSTGQDPTPSTQPSSSAPSSRLVKPASFIDLEKCIRVVECGLSDKQLLSGLHSCYPYQRAYLHTTTLSAKIIVQATATRDRFIKALNDYVLQFVASGVEWPELTTAWLMSYPFVAERIAEFLGSAPTSTSAPTSPSAPFSNRLVDRNEGAGITARTPPTAPAQP